MNAPWRNRMVPGTAPAPIYADDPPMYDGRRPVPPVTTADSAALAALHAPASIASRRAATARQDRPASGPPAEPDRTTGAAGTGDRDVKEQTQEGSTASKDDHAAYGCGTDRHTGRRRAAQGPPAQRAGNHVQGRAAEPAHAAQPLEAGEREQVPSLIVAPPNARAWLTTTGGAEPDRTTGAAGTGESMGDFMQRAQEALTNEGNRWTPAEGDVLAGTLVRIRQIDGQYEKPFRVLTIRPMTGTSPMDVSEKTTLKEAFDEMEAHGLGCQVAIKYLGSRVGKTGGRYESYTAYSEPAAAPVAVDTAAAVERDDALNTPATAPSPGYPQGGAGNTLATDAATMTGLAKAALANSDQEELAHIGARAREAGLVWDRAAQCYNVPAPADAVL